ncbi:Putative HC-toxin efflux carrier TOXA [Talaromyces islandicus]|uniref:Putative HC-toxin efflux carrier TOXA n=1 Tax=Talaromyces islandicus TaxID=28573 RepID=A0A0U1M2U1_TALIS|nr:Putative HC-toxin efflux carrier TOXA [Talaromyces islandicus]
MSNSEEVEKDVDKDAEKAPDAMDVKGQDLHVKGKESEMEYPGMMKRALIMLSVYFSVFLITLDQNIISTAIPQITDEFHSINDISWYGTAYLMTMCTFQLLLGKVYKHYPVKAVFMGGVFLFEVGSAICGAAPSSAVFILGRAIAGLGGSGMITGTMVIMFHTLPLQQRPAWQGAFGAIFAIGSVIGPLVGGAFTNNVTWRWCFYINLPIGGVSLLVTLLILNIPGQKLEPRASTFIGKMKQLDMLGNLVSFPAIICLVLALQWGGTIYAWSNARIIVLFILGGLLWIGFIAIQVWKKEAATVPPRVVKHRSVLGAMWFALFNNAGMMVMIYYLPIWFQAIKGVDAIRSGIMLLPTILATVVGSISSGFIISKIGYYAPFFIFSAILMPVGAGLLTTLNTDTGAGKWIGYQILFGLGVGFGNQQPLNVVQTVLDRPDIAVGSAVVVFLRFLGSSIALPIAQSVFLNHLIANLANLPSINPEDVVKGGVTDLRHLVTPNQLPVLLRDYNDAIINVFYIVVATSSLMVLSCFVIEWKTVRPKK